MVIFKEKLSLLFLVTFFLPVLCSAEKKEVTITLNEQVINIYFESNNIKGQNKLDTLTIDKNTIHFDYSIENNSIVKIHVITQNNYLVFPIYVCQCFYLPNKKLTPTE